MAILILLLMHASPRALFRRSRVLFRYLRGACASAVADYTCIYIGSHLEVYSLRVIRGCAAWLVNARWNLYVVCGVLTNGLDEAKRF